MRIAQTLFHGTAQDFEKPTIHAGTEIFWTAEASHIAQSYIPQVFSYINSNRIFHENMEQPVIPNRNDPFYSVTEMMGFKAIDAQHDRNGNAVKYSLPRHYPKYKDVIAYIENVLGYQSITEYPKQYKLKSSGWDSRLRRDIIESSAYCAPGFLLIISGHDSLQLFDATKTNKGNSLENGHADLALQGYDGIIINDFCITPQGQRVPHRSIGLFSSTFDDLKVERISAGYFDAGNKNTHLQETPEYALWLKGKQTAILDKNSERELTMQELRRKSFRLRA